MKYADRLMEGLCYLGYLWAAGKFCQKYLKVSKKNEILFVLAGFAGWASMNLINRQYKVPYIFLTLLNHLFFMGLVFLLFWGSREKKILVVSLLVTIKTLVGDFWSSFLSCLTLFLLHTVKRMSLPFLNEWEMGAINSVGMFMTILAVHWLSGRLTSVSCGKEKKWYVVLAIPLFAITAMNDVAGWGASNGIMVKSGGSMSVYYDQMFSFMEIMALTTLSMFGAGAYVLGMNRICLEQEKSRQYHSQIAVYKMLEEQYRQSEGLRHDMKNHVIVLSGLLEGEEWENMKAYLKNMARESLETGGDMTGNKAVDALLYQKRKWAIREHIKWECDVHIPKTCPIQEFDLCILFGNLLDNGLEACERMEEDQKRFVNIRARAVKRCFLIEAANSMDRNELYEEGTTKKSRPQEHGIGLLNVRDVVKRYNGVIQIEAENGMFQISILMPFMS